MTTIKRPENPESDPRVKAVFDDIRSTRNSDFIGNIWQYLAQYPDLLESTWSEIKQVMGTESSIPKKYKEMIYAAVSVANGCEYCIHSHTLQAKQAGMSDAEHAELLSIIMLASKTNALLDALQIPVDEVMDQG